MSGRGIDLASKESRGRHLGLPDIGAPLLPDIDEARNAFG
jgi:hypothetical protein